MYSTFPIPNRNEYDRKRIIIASWNLHIIDLERENQFNKTNLGNKISKEYTEIAKNSSLN